MYFVQTYLFFFKLKFILIYHRHFYKIHYLIYNNLLFNFSFKNIISTIYMNIIKLSPKERYYCYDKIIGKGAFKKVYQAYDVKKGIYVAWNSVNLIHLNVSEKKYSKRIK